MKTENYTGITLIISNEEGEPIAHLPPKGEAQISDSVDLLEISRREHFTGAAIPLYKTKQVEGLPEPKAGFTFLVNRKVRQVMAHRRDLLTPNLIQIDPVKGIGLCCDFV